MPRSRRDNLVAVWLTVLTAGLSASTHADDEFRVGSPIPQRILSDWRSRQTRAHSVYWECEEERFVPAAILAGIPHAVAPDGTPLPAGDSLTISRTEMWIDLRQPRVRQALTSQSLNPSTRSVVASAAPQYTLFDGNEVQLYTPDWRPPNGEQGTVLQSFGPLDQSGGTFPDAAHMPCLWSIGVLFDFHNLPSLARLTEAFKPQGYRIVSVQKQAGESVVVIRHHPLPDQPTYYFEYHVNVDKMSAITEYTCVVDGHATAKINVNWIRDEQTWRPESWVTVNRAGGAELVCSVEGRVTKYSADVPLDNIEFHVEPKAGAWFVPRDSTTVMVKGAGENVDVPLEIFQIEQAASAARWRWVFAVAVILALGVAAVWRSRRRV